MEFVYVFRQNGTDLYKIGRAVDIKQRRKSLQIGNPAGISLVCAVRCDRASSKVEGSLHARFRQFAVSGEWFKLSQSGADVLAWMIELIAISRDTVVIRDEEEAGNVAREIVDDIYGREVRVVKFVMSSETARSRVIEYLHANPADVRLSVRKLADIVGVGKSTVGRVIKSAKIS